MTVRRTPGGNATAHSQVRAERPNTVLPTLTAASAGEQVDAARALVPQVQGHASDGIDAVGFAGGVTSTRGNTERVLGAAPGPSSAQALGVGADPASRTGAVHQRIQLLMGSTPPSAASAHGAVALDVAPPARVDQTAMTLEEALAARARAPSKEAFFATEPTFDSLATFARVTLEGHVLGATFAGSVPSDRNLWADKPWAPNPTDLFIRNAAPLFPASFRGNVSEYHRDATPDRLRHETKAHLEVNGPWPLIQQAWPEILETSKSKFVVFNGNYIYKEMLLQPSAVGLLGAANRSADFDTIHQHSREQVFGKLSPDGSIQVQSNPGAHFIADALAENTPKLTIYRGESLFSARRVDFLRELATGAPSAKTVKNLDAALADLELHLKDTTRVQFQTRNVKAELKAIPKLRRMLAGLSKTDTTTGATPRARGADPMKVAAALLTDINRVPYLFAGVSREHAKGFAKPGFVLSKYELDLSQLSPRAAADFHLGADNMFGVELGLRFDTVEHAMEAVKALQRVSMTEPLPPR